MTWSELLQNRNRINTLWDEQREWIKEATEFGNKYNVIIRLKGHPTSCGTMLLIEMTHPDDPKNTVKYIRNDGTYISERDRISNYFEHLYDKLPIVRRNRNKQSKESLRNLMEQSAIEHKAVLEYLKDK